MPTPKGHHAPADTVAESLIQKTAVVRSIHDAIVGCQFEGEHPCDANIAFYVLT